MTKNDLVEVVPVGGRKSLRTFGCLQRLQTASEHCKITIAKNQTAPSRHEGFACNL